MRHCLEKNPEQRFHSARDMAFDLANLSELSGSNTAIASARGRRPWFPMAALASVFSDPAARCSLAVHYEPPLNSCRLPSFDLRVGHAQLGALLARWSYGRVQRGLGGPPGTDFSHPRRIPPAPGHRRPGLQGGLDLALQRDRVPGWPRALRRTRFNAGARSLVLWLSWRSSHSRARCRPGDRTEASPWFTSSMDATVWSSPSATFLTTHPAGSAKSGSPGR